MRRFLAALFVTLLVPVSAHAATATGAPTVVVYPFTPNGGTIDKEAPAKLATLIATQIAQGGEVAVKAPPAVIERKDYLTAARAMDVDYYLSGFITPLGDGVTVVEQLVSSSSGIVVFSDTATLSTYADAQGIGDHMRAAILAQARRNLPVNAPPPPQTAATPQPAASGRTEANIGGLFKNRKKAAAATAATALPTAAATNVPATALKIPPTAGPTAAPIPAAAATARAVATGRPAATAAATAAASQVAAAAGGATGAAIALTAIGGDADAALRDAAAQTAGAAFTAAHREFMRAESASTGCAAGAAGTMSGTLSTAVADKQFGGTTATFELIVRDCQGNQKYRRVASADAGGTESARIATVRAVESAVGAYLHPPASRRR